MANTKKKTTTKNSPSNGETKKKSRLGSVKRSRLAQPIRWFIYGPEAIGKTLLADSAGNTIFADVEEGSGHIEAQRYPFNPGEPDEFKPRDYQQVLSMLKELREEDHDFDTLAIDTADALEQLIWKYIVERDAKSTKKKLESIEDYGYGKGYTIALEEWERFCRELDRLRSARGMQIIILGHSMIKVFKNPVADDYDRFMPRLHDKASGLLKGWVDMVGFYTFEEEVDDGFDSKRRAKGVSTGQRIMYFKREAAYDAKRRYAVPDWLYIEHDSLWEPIADAIEKARAASPEDMRTLIEKEQKRIGDAQLDELVNEHVGKAGDDMARLAEILGRLKSKEATKAAAS